MGQSQAVRPRDLSTRSGPLWCIPVARGFATVWCDLPPGYHLDSIEGPGGPVSPHERYRIFSPRQSLHFYGIASDGLHDGQEYRIFARSQGASSLKSEAGRDVSPDESLLEQFCELRLANAHTEGVAQILSFIVQKIVPKLSRTADLAPLQRFLSFVSSWRIPARQCAVLGAYHLYSVPVAGGRLPEQFSGFMVFANGLQRRAVRYFSLQEGGIFIVEGPVPKRGYVEIEDELVEIDFEEGSAPLNEQTTSWFRALPASATQNLIGHLSDIVAQEAAQFPSMIANAARTARIELIQPGARIDALHCLFAGDALLLFLDIMSDGDIENVGLQLFGREEERLPACPIAHHREAAAGEGSPARTRMVLSTPLAEAPLACKVFLQCDGENVDFWIRVQGQGTAQALAAASRFLPAVRQDARYRAQVLAPLARDWARAHARGMIVESEYPFEGEAPMLDLCIVAGDDFDALHRTLIGLRGSLPERQPVRVVVVGSLSPERDGATVANWLARYGFPAHCVSLHPLEIAPARAGDLAAFSACEIAVAIRAGFVPPQAGWWERLVAEVRMRPQDAFLGLAAKRIEADAAERAAVSRGGFAKKTGVVMSRDELLDAFSRNAVGAVAASSGLVRDHAAELPVCHSLIGGWIEWLLQVSEAGGEVVAHPSLSFWDAAEAENRDMASHRLDLSNLSAQNRAEDSEEEAAETASTLTRLAPLRRGH